MALRALCFRSTSWKVNEVLSVVAIPTRGAHTEDSPISRVNFTHAITTADYNGEKSPKWLEFISDYKPLWDIRKRSGAVVRHGDMSNAKKVIDTEDEESAEENGTLLLVGNPEQLKSAVTLLNKELDLRLEMRSHGEQYMKMAGTSSYNPYSPFHSNNLDKKLWEGYRRNFKGQYAPEKPRASCMKPKRDQFVLKGQCGNPCPLCQMIYLFGYNVHFTDIEILNHFLCPHTGDIYPTTRTNICKIQHNILVAHVQKARMHGFLPFRWPLPSLEKKTAELKYAGMPNDRFVKVQRNRSWNKKLYRSPKNHGKHLKNNVGFF